MDKTMTPEQENHSLNVSYTTLRVGLGQEVKTSNPDGTGVVTALWPMDGDIQMFIRWRGASLPKEVWLLSEAQWIEGGVWHLQEDASLKNDESPVQPKLNKAIRNTNAWRGGST